MQIKEKNIEQQIQLWAIAGPFITLLTLLVSMMKPSGVQTGFAICLLVGVPLCWKWKLKGLAISIGILLSVLTYHIVDLDFSEVLWNAGLGLSASLSFLITALTFHEVASLTETLQVESKSRLENLLKLDEKLKFEKENFTKNQEHLSKNIRDLEEEVIKHKDRAAANERLAQVVREELASTHSRNDELLQEVFDWRHNYQKVESEVKALKEEIQATMESVDKSKLEVASKEISSLTGQLEHAREQLEAAQAKCEYSEEERLSNEAALLEKSREAEDLKKEIEEIRFFNEIIQDELLKLKDQLKHTLHHEGELLKAQKIIEEQNEQIKSIKLTLDERERELLLEKQKIEELLLTASEKEMVLQQLVQEAKSERDKVFAKQEKDSKKESAELRKIKGKHTQLQKQFKEKSEVLDETRRALFHMQEKLLTAQREAEEVRKADRSDTEALLEQTIAKMELERKELEENHQQEIDDLHDIIASLSASN